MFLSGYVFAFVIGVAVGFVFSSIILFGNRLDHIAVGTASSSRGLTEKLAER